jgi:hypothetical protein
LRLAAPAATFARTKAVDRRPLDRTVRWQHRTPPASDNTALRRPQQVRRPGRPAKPPTRLRQHPDCRRPRADSTCACESADARAAAKACHCADTPPQAERKAERSRTQLRATTFTRYRTRGPRPAPNKKYMRCLCDMPRSDVLPELVLTPNARGNRREPAQRVSVRLTEMLGASASLVALACTANTCTDLVWRASTHACCDDATD